MKKLILMLCLLLPTVSYGQQADTIVVKDTIPQVYIPRDLSDCIRQLDSMLSPEDKAYIQSGKSVHFTLGMWMRNNWGLWAGSRLQTYFTGNGIHHPDDMSGVILDCYVLHLNGEKVNYKRMLRKAHRDEVKWAKRTKAWEEEEQRLWEYVDRYDCDLEDSTITFEMATAFLHLPLTVDSVVGTQIYKREKGEPEEVEIRRIEKILQRKPIFTPHPDALVRSALDIYYGRQPKDRVKQMVQEDVDGLHRYEYLFNPDGTLAEVKGWNRKSDTSQIHTWRDEYIYHDGKLVTERNYKDDTLNRETRYLYMPDYRLQTYTYTPASPDVAVDSNQCLLSPEGLLLVTYRKDGGIFCINEYDTLGREVTVLWYRDRCLRNWWSNVYDDAQNLYYEIHRSVFEHVVTCNVLNEQGDMLGECCANKLDIFDRKKTYFSYRYDRHGNWTHRYEMGKLSTRCKITYYK